MTLYQIIKALQDAPAKGGGKKAVLSAHKNNSFLKEFLHCVYNPRINYFVTKMPKVTGEGIVIRDLCMDDLYDMQSVLAERQVTGKAATAWLKAKLESLTDEGRELIGYIVGRDIRAGVAESTILDYFPGLFFIPPYQRCASMDEKLKDKFGKLPYFYVQTKSDGQFSYAIHSHGGEATAMSRAGSIYPDWVARQITLGVPEGYVAMGEMLMYRNDVLLSRKDGNGILNSVLSGDGTKFNQTTDEISFVAWDMVTREEFEQGFSERDYDERWAELQKTSLDLIPCWKVSSVKEANQLQREHLARKEEGTVWKTGDMKWRDCSSGDPNMMKAKLVFDADFEIEGAYVHKKNPNMLGGFNMKTRDGLIRFDVGSGFSEEQRLKYWKMLQIDMECFNGTVATCEGNDIVTSKGKDTESLYLPIFVELRLDKKEADSRERVWEQFEAAKLGKAL